jgi:hypothetical protein
LFEKFPFWRGRKRGRGGSVLVEIGAEFCVIILNLCFTFSGVKYIKIWPYGYYDINWCLTSRSTYQVRLPRKVVLLLHWKYSTSIECYPLQRLATLLLEQFRAQRSQQQRDNLSRSLERFHGIGTVGGHPHHEVSFPPTNLDPIPGTPSFLPCRNPKTSKDHKSLLTSSSYCWSQFSVICGL